MVIFFGHFEIRSKKIVFVGCFVFFGAKDVGKKKMDGIKLKQKVKHKLAFMMEILIHILFSKKYIKTNEISYSC